MELPHEINSAYLSHSFLHKYMNKYVSNIFFFAVSLILKTLSLKVIINVFSVSLKPIPSFLLPLGLYAKCLGGTKWKFEKSFFSKFPLIGIIILSMFTPIASSSPYNPLAFFSFVNSINSPILYLVNSITNPPKCLFQHLLGFLFLLQYIFHLKLNTSHFLFIINI